MLLIARYPQLALWATGMNIRFADSEQISP
jgi:hypothetical protein